jgi:uncharacterized membrane protein
MASPLIAGGLARHTCPVHTGDRATKVNEAEIIGELLSIILPEVDALFSRQRRKVERVYLYWVLLIMRYAAHGETFRLAALGKILNRMVLQLNAIIASSMLAPIA